MATRWCVAVDPGYRTCAYAPMHGFVNFPPSVSRSEFEPDCSAPHGGRKTYERQGGRGGEAQRKKGVPRGTTRGSTTTALSLLTSILYFVFSDFLLLPMVHVLLFPIHGTCLETPSEGLVKIHGPDEMHTELPDVSVFRMEVHVPKPAKPRLQVLQSSG